MQITIRNLQKKLPINYQKTRKIAVDTLSLERIKKKVQINILFVDDKKISAYNRRYLGKNHPTDVIAFDLSENKKDKISADIVISAQTAISNSKIFGTTPASELNLYLIHGILHILGYDDNNKKNQKVMYKRQNSIHKRISTCP